MGHGRYRGLHGAWTSNFPDHSATSFFVEATYGGSLVLQELLVWVDGGRYVLPVPRIVQSKSKANQVEYHVETRRLILARLLHGLGGGFPGHDPDRGVEQAGWLVAG